MIKFSPANAKLQKLAAKKGAKGKVYSLDLPAGLSCPGAHECKSHVVKTQEGYRIVDGPHCRFRCYAASAEVIFPKTYQLRRHNLKALRKAKTPRRMANLILRSLPSNCSILRLHASGDFFSEAYYQAILMVVRERRDIHFYTYTKALKYWTQGGMIPFNLILTASCGGKYDRLIKKYGLRSCRVVLTKQEARKLKLKLDHDDSLASSHGPDFAVLIHGMQPMGSESMMAVYNNRLQGIRGYGRKYKINKQRKGK